MNSFRIVRILCSAVISLSLAIHGKRKNSLSITGAMSAVFVGFVSMACGYRFGLILLIFYYSSSKFTKMKEERKRQLEFNYSVGGQRTWVQVFSNSILATLTSLIYVVFFGDAEYLITLTPSHNMISIFGFKCDANTVQLMLVCAYVAHYSCAAADTWASEIGVLSRSNPRMITSLLLKEVPPGTNGGMSLVGTLASAAGGMFIGAFIFAYDLLIYGHLESIFYVLVGLITGLMGSIIDSLLGGLLQATFYSPSRKCIVKLEDVKKVDDAKIISGINVLTNDMVNVLSILITMIVSVISIFVFVQRS